MRYVLILLVTSGFLSSFETKQCEAQQRLAREQPSIPSGWTEVPFIETVRKPILTSAERQRGYLLFQRPITEPVYANTHPRADERVVSLSALGTPGEFEPITISLYPIQDLKNMTVVCSELTSNNFSIPASQIDIRIQTYWNVGFPRYASRETYRRVPELLEKVTAHSSVAQECQRWWLTVHVPEDAKPGLYQGTVSLQDDRFDQPVKIPLSFRVLGFKLQKDPRKHLSAYYYPRNRTMFAGKDEAFIDRATANEFRSMKEHGLDMLPTFYLQYDRSEQKIYVQHDTDIDRLLTMGFQGPLPVLGGNAIARIYQKLTPGGERGSHWNINKMPPAEFYEELTTLFRQLKKECKDRGWPEIVCCPIDEVSAARSEFGSKVYKAVHDAGVRTYATKYPQATDAVPYKPYVDIWCSQPYAMPYEKIIADKKYEYWSYPNHNAGERKNRRVMCKGGRMTYGFGFWRSGYTTLIPWHWAWTMSPDPFDYLRTKQSGCGQRIGDDGEVIPTIYWECFREGYDDARYLYTLQQTAWERVGSSNLNCNKLVEQARETLQETWDAIEVQERYLDKNMWPSSEFNTRRWRMAMLIEKLLKFPASRQGTAPSVYLERTAQGRAVEKSIIKQAEEQGNIESFDLGEDFKQWRAETPESSLQILSKKGVLLWNVNVDHKAGGQPDGKYHVGWPRFRRTFNKNTLDLTAYDFLEVQLQVDSNRDEVQDDVTQLGLSLSSRQVRRLYEIQRDLGDRQREKIRISYSIPEMIRTADKGIDPWKSLAHLQFFISEANYAHGTKLQFEFESIKLLRFKSPMISQIDVPKYIMLPRSTLAIPFEIMGTRSVKKGSHKMTATLSDSSGKLRTYETLDLATNRLLVLDLSAFTPGKYQLDIFIKTKNGKSCYKTSKTIIAINGPTR